MGQTNHAELFRKLLSVSALLPRADVDIQRKYNLSRKQIYLIYLIQQFQEEGLKLSDYANILNISPSTLTRNIEKLEERRIIQRVSETASKTIQLKLLSLGQLYAIEISTCIDNYFLNLSAKNMQAISLLTTIDL
jgi:DNA-binding MarR family transcriptional regulator